MAIVATNQAARRAVKSDESVWARGLRVGSREVVPSGEGAVTTSGMIRAAVLWLSFHDGGKARGRAEDDRERSQRSVFVSNCKKS